MKATAGAAIRKIARSACSELVDLRLVLAVGAEPLPQERDRVQPQDVDADVREPEHRLGDRDEHLGVGVVEVPLEAVEGRPHPAPVDLGEAPGRRLGEHLGQRPLVRVGLGPVGELVVEAGPRGPLMLGRRMVEDDVDAQGDPGRAQLVGQLSEIVDAPECRLDRSVVDDRVAAVVRFRAGVEQRHQVQVGDAELPQVGEVLADAGERAGEAVDVGDVPDRLLALEPVRRDLALVVEPAQDGRALRGRPGDRAQECRPRLRAPGVGSVQRPEGVAQLCEEPLEPNGEGVVAPHRFAGALVLGPYLGSHRKHVLHAICVSALA